MPSFRVLSHAFRAWRRNLKWRKHEPETPYLADLLAGAPTCLHVGASDGRHSYVMTQVAPRATIYAIEPSAFSFQVLKITLAWHGIADRVTPVHAAVGNKPGEMLLVTPRKITGRMGRAYAFVADAPPVLPSASRATPKSPTFTRPSAERRMLAGLMSRCTIRWAWARASARHSWVATPQASHAGSGPRFWFQVVPDVKTLKNRLHLDVISDTFAAALKSAYQEHFNITAETYLCDAVDGAWLRNAPLQHHRAT